MVRTGGGDGAARTMLGLSRNLPGGSGFSHPSLNEEGRTCVPEMMDRADILELIKVYAERTQKS